MKWKNTFFNSANKPLYDWPCNFLTKSISNAIPHLLKATAVHEIIWIVWSWPHNCKKKGVINKPKLYFYWKTENFKFRSWFMGILKQNEAPFYNPWPHMSLKKKLVFNCHWRTGNWKKKILLSKITGKWAFQDVIMCN